MLAKCCMHFNQHATVSRDDLLQICCFPKLVPNDWAQIHSNYNFHRSSVPTCVNPSTLCGVALENPARSSMAYAVDETVELDRWEH